MHSYLVLEAGRAMHALLPSWKPLAACLPCSLRQEALHELLNSGIAVLLRLFKHAPDSESVLPSTGDLLTHLLTISPHTHLLTITPLVSLWQPR